MFVERDWLLRAWCYIPLWEFAEFPWRENQTNKQTNNDSLTRMHVSSKMVVNLKMSAAQNLIRPWSPFTGSPTNLFLKEHYRIGKKKNWSKIIDLHKTYTF